MEHELTNEINLDRENNSLTKSPAEPESQNNNYDFPNSSSVRNNRIEESKETGNMENLINHIAIKLTTDLNSPNILANIAHKQDSLAEELESLRETVIKMQEEIRILTTNYTQLKSETTKPNKNDASALRKNDLLKSYATTTPNKAEKTLKVKKSEVINTKTPLSKTTINLKPDNQEAEKIKDERMYRTVKSNNKDLKKTNTDKSVVRKTEKKGEENNLKKSKLAEHSATFSTDAKDKDKEKISLQTKIKKPLNGGAARTLKDKSAIENESKKYMTEKSNNKSYVRASLNEKMKDNQEKEEKPKKQANKDLVKPTPTKKQINKDKLNPDQDKKKKEEVVDSHHTKRKEEPSVNPFPDQTKNVEIEVTNLPESVRNVENHPSVEEKPIEVESKLVEENNTDNKPEEVDINLAENIPVNENSEKPEEKISEGEN